MKLGSSIAEVQSILGNPDRRSTNGSKETWSYSIYSDNKSRIYPYQAKFQNGKLVEFNFDTMASKADTDLRKQRRDSKQDMYNINNTNGSPPIEIDK